MTTAEKKAYLWSYGELQKKLISAKGELERYRLSFVMSSKGQDGMPRARRNKDLSTYTAGLDERERRIRKIEVESIQRMADILYYLSKMKDEKQRFLLEKRYLYFWSWEKIAEDLNIETKTAYNLHGESLKIFRKN